MNTLTLKIPASLEAALQAASTRRQVSKSALVREALQRALVDELAQATPVAQWANRWRGALAVDTAAESQDARVAHILRKHAR